MGGSTKATLPAEVDFIAQLADFVSFEGVGTCLGEEGARAVQMCSKRNGVELRGSSAATQSKDEEQMRALELERVYSSLEKNLCVIERVNRHFELDDQCKALLAKCKEEALKLVVFLHQHNRLPAMLAEKVVLLFGEDGESAIRASETDIGQVD